MEPEEPEAETEFGLMGANKTKQAGSLSAGMSVVRILLRPHNRGLVLCVVIVVAAIGASMYAWRRWGEPATHRQRISGDAGEYFSHAAAGVDSRKCEG